MKVIPFAIIFASAIFCNSIRQRLDPTPTPLPTLGSVATPTPGSSTPQPFPGDEPPRPGDANSLEPPTPPTQKPVPGTISGGVLNGKAKSLPRPEYPAAARAVKATGAVSVQVLVDETGKVVSAKAISGHPLLRASAEKAANDAVFEPTMLSGKAVKVSGILTFNFTP